VKSSNFLRGQGPNSDVIYSIDFGLAKRYRHPHTGQHIQLKNHQSLIGTARFVSIHTHYGLLQSRRDDLESLGYLFVYLAKGKLPWQNMKAKEKLKKY